MRAAGTEVWVEFADARWQASDVSDASAMITRAVCAVIDREAPGHPVEIGIRLTNDSEIQSLNRDWRGQDKPTNVLAFALGEDEQLVPADPAQTVPLGDVVVAFETCAREAREESKSIANHLCHLVVHGTLHLLGYDHDVADDAEIMEAAEREILSGLGIPDPYADSVAA